MADETAGDGASPLRAVVEVVVRALVDQPDAVRVTESVRRGMTVLELTTAPGDMGKIIGRSGATAKAIRTILRVVGMKHDARVNLKIEEPEGSERRFDREAPRDRSVDDVIADLKGEQ